MPEIARFLGIVIGIFPREHPPPHFHAVYGEYQITVDIQSGVVSGDFPKRALRHVLEWFDLHQDELLEDWDLVQAGHAAKRIAHWSRPMIPKVITAKHVDAYVIRLRFADGTEGEVDLAQELYGELFEPLRDLQTFRKFKVHPDFHTLCWPNGADIAPEFLYERIMVPA